MGRPNSRRAEPAITGFTRARSIFLPYKCSENVDLAARKRKDMSSRASFYFGTSSVGLTFYSYRSLTRSDRGRDKTLVEIGSAIESAISGIRRVLTD